MGINHKKLVKEYARSLSVPINEDQRQELLTKCRKAGLVFMEMLRSTRPDIVAGFEAIYPMSGAVGYRKSFVHYLLTGDVSRCVDCGTVVATPNTKRCKGSCASRTAMKKTHTTLKRRYGGVGYGAISIKKKAFATTLKRHGVKCGVEGHLREKGVAIMLERYGTDNTWKMPHVREAFKKRYEDPAFVRRVRQSYERTMEERYGDEWRVIAADQLANARYKFHELQLGKKTFRVQGYEPHVLKELIAKGVKLKHLETYSRSFVYIKKNGKKAIYRPDIVVPSHNLIVEVKSTYTAGLQKNGAHMWKELQEKSSAVASAGEQLTLVVVVPKTGYFSLRDPHLYTKKQALRLVNFKPFTWT